MGVTAGAQDNNYNNNNNNNNNNHPHCSGSPLVTHLKLFGRPARSGSRHNWTTLISKISAERFVTMEQLEANTNSTNSTTATIKAMTSYVVVDGQK